MKRIPTAKRNQLIVVLASTGLVLALVYFMLINPQKDANSNLGGKIASEQEKLKTIKTAISDRDIINARLADISLQLNGTETDVAGGDIYAWTYDMIRRFKATYHVDIPNIGQPTLSDMDMLPNFPYRQVKVSISGTAYYHDLGKFVSDFENKFPHMRMANISIEPASLTGASADRLSFRLDIIALVKPNT